MEPTYTPGMQPRFYDVGEGDIIAAASRFEAWRWYRRTAELPVSDCRLCEGMQAPADLLVGVCDDPSAEKWPLSAILADLIQEGASLPIQLCSSQC